MKKLANEPVAAATVALVAATIALLVAFGVHVTADQREAIEAWVLAVIGLGVLVRAKVTPTSKVQQAVDEARTLGQIETYAKHVLPAAEAKGANVPAPVAPEGIVLPGPTPTASSGTV